MYAKLIDGTLVLPPKVKGGCIGYDENVDALIHDGWKFLITSEKPQDGLPYIATYEEDGNTIVQGWLLNVKTLEEQVQYKEAEINKACSSEIVSGFWYNVNGESYHFSYDQLDQLNFVRADKRAREAKAAGIERTVNWNAYKEYPHKEVIIINFNIDEFIKLYDAGEEHLQKCMNKAGLLKYQVSQVTEEQYVKDRHIFDKIVWS